MDKSKAYELLGVSPQATEDDVKEAYRVLAKTYSAQNYEAGPLREDAEKKMNELNEAFDLVMSILRTGAEPANATPDGAAPTQTPVGRYPSIRQLINSGRADEALAELSAIPYGSTDAEWNFLMGSAYYYKGWLQQAYQYFAEAVRLDPTNREYQAALRNLSGSANGEMPGNPYNMEQNPNGAALNCACNTCTMMCCMDACCSMCRGI